MDTLYTTKVQGVRKVPHHRDFKDFFINMVPCQNIFGKNEKQEPKESHVNISLRLSRRIFEIKNCLYNLGRELFDYGFYCGKDEKGVYHSKFLK